MELRAAFLYARGDSGAELGGCADCSDRADLLLELHTDLCDGGVVTRTCGATSPSDGDDTSVHVTLRRERPGCYVCVGLELAFTCGPGQPVCTLPLTIRVGGDVLIGSLRCAASEDGTAVTYAVEVVHAQASGGGSPPLRSYELVLVGHDEATQRPVCLGCTVQPGPSRAADLLGGFPAQPDQVHRGLSGRRPALCTLEPIDENTKCDLSAECAALTPHRGAASPPQGALLPAAFSRASPAACDWDVPATFDPFGDGTVFDRSVSCGDMGDAQLDTGDSSLSWFSAGLRVGLGIGFGVCLGAGIGVGILLNGYRGAHARAHRLKNVVFG